MRRVIIAIFISSIGITITNANWFELYTLVSIALELFEGVSKNAIDKTA